MTEPDTVVSTTTGTMGCDHKSDPDRAALALTPEGGGKPLVLSVEEVPGGIVRVRLTNGTGEIVGYAPALCARVFARDLLRVTANALGVVETARADGKVFDSDAQEGE